MYGLLKNNFEFKEIELIEFEKTNFLKVIFFLLRECLRGYKGTINYKKLKF